MSRQIVDAEGTAWEVSVGREAYGMQVLLFFPSGGAGIRKAMLAASTGLEAQHELDAMDDAALRERLDASVPWESPLGG